MSAQLKIWSNHLLGFSSAKDAICKFESILKTKITPCDFSENLSIATTKNFNEVKYFTNHETLDYNFHTWGKVRIRTNFQFCNELLILPGALSINPIGFSTKYSKWVELAGNTQEQYDADSQNEHWLELRAYAHTIICKLGGSKIIYWDDQSYQTYEDELYKGVELQIVLTDLTSRTKPKRLDIESASSNSSLSLNTWHYEDMNCP